MKWVKYYFCAAALFLAGCAPFVTTSPTTGGKKLLGMLPVPFTKPSIQPTVDPYAIWQQWAIFIVIGGIVIGAIDYFMDRKLTMIGPIIFGCGLIVSVWGITLPIVAKFLPWLLGALLIMWIIRRYLIARGDKTKKKSDAPQV